MRRDVPTHTEEAPPAAEVWSPASYALMSVLVPGLGQIAQRRPVAAAIQLGAVVTYLGAAYSLGGGRAVWLALLWNAWSAIDAWWRAPR
jgi:hypothetical protein